jgi:cell division protein FtsX
VTTSTNPVTTSTNPVTTSTNPVTTSTNPVTTSTNPVTTSTNPVTTSTNPVTTNNANISPFTNMNNDNINKTKITEKVMNKIKETNNKLENLAIGFVSILIIIFLLVIANYIRNLKK